MLSPEVELYDELRKVAPEDLTRAITRYVDGTNDRKIMEKLQGVATKQDISALTGTLRGEISDLRTEMLTARTEMLTAIERSNTNLERGLKDTMRWMFGFWITTMFALVGVLIGILKG